MSDQSLEKFITDISPTIDTAEITDIEDIPEIANAFLSQHNSYETQQELLTEYADLQQNSRVVIGNCGTGSLIERLSTTVDYNLYGFDTRESLLDITAGKTDATLFKSTLVDFYVPKPIDCFASFDTPLFALSSTEMIEFFQQLYNSLGQNSTVFLGYNDSEQIQDGASEGNKYHTNKYSVRRNTVNTIHSDMLVKTYSYRVTEQDSNTNVFQTGFMEKGYIHNPQKIRKELTNIGFTNITIAKPDNLNMSLIIARKVS